jgi:hypothetical protein
MSTVTLQEQCSPVDTAPAWAVEILQECSTKTCTAIGLINGSRFGCDRRVVDALAGMLDQARGHRRITLPMLLVRLQVEAGISLERPTEQMDSAPPLSPSPLGNWSEVSIQVPIGRRASWALEQLPHWLFSWKRQFPLVLIDLGPIHEVPSRIVGRLCSGCYILLGPEACASRDWILQHVAWHEQSGSTICGTLVTTQG